MASVSPTNQGGFLEQLSKTMGDLAGLSVLPDATDHVGFVNELMKAIQTYIHHPNVGGQALGAGGPGQPSMAMTGQGTPGVMPGAAMPNPDELRRMLTAVAQ
jgi:hypothetical protein